MRVLQINDAYADDLVDPDALLDRYSSLTGWSQAIAGAGAHRVCVAQRFHQDARLRRRDGEYVFYRDRLAGLGTRAALVSIVREVQPDVVHVNGLDFVARAWWLRRVLPEQTAIVVQDHASRPPAPGQGWGIAVKRSLQRLAMRAPDGFLFTAREQADPWRQAGLISNAQSIYEVLESSTTIHVAAESPGREPACQAGRPTVLWVGRLNANKDPVTVLEGFERALRVLPDAALTMAYGADDLLPVVTARIDRSSRLRRQVTLLGRVSGERMTRLYRSADVFVLGSHYEGSGYALIEACACGAVPVVTDIPAFRTMTRGGAIGALWAPGDAHAFATALQVVGRFQPGSLRRRVREHFDRNLSWAAVGRQAMGAYAGAIATRRLGARGRLTTHSSGGQTSNISK